MMFYKCETFDKNGKIIDSKHVEVKVGGVSDATKNAQVLSLKKKAQQQGHGFRVKREDD
jgi:hypothetical protein